MKKRLKTQHSESEDHGIWSHHFMGSRWGTVETVAKFIFLGSKITADGDRSHEIKGSLLLRSRVMTNLDSILKTRDSVGDGGVICENGIETCIISYMKQIASPGSMHDTGCLGLVNWDDPEGWYG